MFLSPLLKALDPAVLQTLGVQAIESLGNGLVQLIFSSAELPGTLAAQLAI